MISYTFEIAQECDEVDSLFWVALAFVETVDVLLSVLLFLSVDFLFDLTDYLPRLRAVFVLEAL